MVKEKERMFYVLDHPGNYSALEEKFCGACEAARKGQKGWRKALRSIRSSGDHVLMLWSQTQLGAKEGGWDPGRKELQLRKVWSQETKDRMIFSHSFLWMLIPLSAERLSLLHLGSLFCPLPHPLSLPLSSLMPSLLFSLQFQFHGGRLAQFG